jgi:predicted dehydrogenase
MRQIYFRTPAIFFSRLPWAKDGWRFDRLSPDTRLFHPSDTKSLVIHPSMTTPAKIVVIGAGWWSQGWHIPQLDRNERAELVAIVDSDLPKEPSSSKDDDDTPKKDDNGQPPLLSMKELADKYHTQVFSSIVDLMDAGLAFDGVVIATPHSTHFEIAKQFVGTHHILLEKPMTTDVHEAYQLAELVKQKQSELNGSDEISNQKQVFLNHTANYRSQTMAAREAVLESVGRIQSVSITMAAALKWLFDDPAQTTWTQLSGNMIGNGFGWGQSAHPLAWIAYVCPQLRPTKVLACHMIQSPRSGADMALSATILLSYQPDSVADGATDDHQDNVVIMSISGTSLLPGNEHSDPPVGKLFDFQIYGDQGAVLYSGDTRSIDSGNLQVRNVSTGGTIEYPCQDQGFEFENCEAEGDGPESLQNLLDACQFGSGFRNAADVTVGLRTVQIIDAMYRSHKSGQPEKVLYSD